MKLKDDTHTEQPKGFEIKDNEDKLSTLSKPLYGLEHPPEMVFDVMPCYN